MPFGNYDEPRPSTHLDKKEFGNPCGWADEKKPSKRGRKKKVVAEEVVKVDSGGESPVDGGGESPVDSGAGTLVEQTTGPVEKEPEIKKEEDPLDTSIKSTEEKDETICIDGIDYMMEESGEVVDVEVFTVMGQWVDGKMVLAEGMEEKHNESINI